jgi:hypothetical protein
MQPLLRSRERRFLARVACVFSVEAYNTVDRPLSSWGKTPFGLSIITACLEAAGHQVRCWVICPATPLDRIAAEMLVDFGCDLVAASAVTTQFPLIASFCQQIKAFNSHMPVTVGGAHPSLNPDATIAHPVIDAICIGEGEAAAVAYANAIEAHRQPTQIPGMWIKVPRSSPPSVPVPFPILSPGSSPDYEIDRSPSPRFRPSSTICP